MFLRFLRRLLMTLGALSLAPLLIAMVMWLWRPSSTANDSILHVVLDGPLNEAPEGAIAALWKNGNKPSLASLTDKLRRAGEDPRIVGLLLEVRTPEVGMAQLEELSRATEAFAASKKPSHAFLETAGEGSRGDGAYALAALAQNIMLAPPGEISLFGMHADVPFARGTLDRAKVDANVQQRYEFKSYAETFSQKGFTEPHRLALKSLLDDLQETYLTVVSRGRQTTPLQVRNWIVSSPFSASEALTHKLVDSVGYWDEMVVVLERIAGRKEPLINIDAYEPPVSKGSKTQVAFVVGSGEINRGSGGRSPFGGAEGMGSEVYVDALRQAREDGVAAVLLRLDSPGGSYLASDLIRREVALTRDQNIPVVVSMGDVAASGGYFIAAEADHIVVESGSITGSIGVVSVSFAVRRALQDFFGLQFDSYSTLPHPGMMGFLDPPTPAQSEQMGRNIDKIYQDFVGKVAAGRHKSYDEIHQVAKGRVWSGKQAVRLGLADEIGGIDTAVAYLRRRLDLPEQTQLELLLYPEPDTAWDMVRTALDGQARGGMWLHKASTWLGQHSAQLQALGAALQASERTGVQAVAPQVAPL